VGSGVRVAIGAALLSGALAGCGAQLQPPTATAASVVATPHSGEPWYDEVAPAAAAGPVTACRMPVTFHLPAGWRARPVTPEGGRIDDPARRGGATLTCEVDAEPAGHLGFLRVWTAPVTTRPRPGLLAFLAADPDVTGVEYRDAMVAGRSAVEASYLRIDELHPEGRRERGLALRLGGSAVLLTVSGFDAAEFRAVLPAYVLARQTLAPATAPRARPR
jgi:hypothetical protein